jgi:hypothetical protein
MTKAMAEITMTITVQGLAPFEAQKLAEFVQTRLINERNAKEERVTQPNAVASDVTVDVGNVDGASGTSITTHGSSETGNDADRMFGARKPKPATAPDAEPTTSPEPATVSAGQLVLKTDSRGVVFSETFHSGTAAEPGKNADGSWKKRRGHDPKGLAAYEATYLRAGNAATAQTAGVAAKNPAAAGHEPTQNTVSYAEFIRLWTSLVIEERVSPAIERWVATFGGHPISEDEHGGNVFITDREKRQTVYNRLLLL